ncbi:unnamed protein product, partial [Tetraodon nigroviridis]
KQTCCVPSFLLCLLVLACLFAGLALMAVVHVDGQNRTANGVLVAMGGVVAVALLLNVKTCWRLVDSVVNSQRKRLHGAANRLHKLKSEAFINVLNHQVELMAKMAKTIDASRTTRPDWPWSSTAWTPASRTRSCTCWTP